MDTKELLKYQLDASANQVNKVLENLTEDQCNGKLNDNCMSPRDTISHLTECYIAAGKDLVGEKHEWGSYVPADDDLDAMTYKMQEERKSVKDAILASDNEKAGEIATQYIVLHDAYHVGQLATYRIGADPEWDAYAIYS